MSEQNQQPEVAAEEQQEAVLQIQRIYVKDVSFEAPNLPHIFHQEWKPKLGFDLSTEAVQVGEDLYEVTLNINVETTMEDSGDVAFICEVKQAGVFTISGLEDVQMAHCLTSQCPNMLFPYARELISNLVNRGTFPALNLSPVNFDALFIDYMNKQQAAAEAEENQETIIDCFNEQLKMADRIEIAVGYISNTSLVELDRLVDECDISEVCLNIGMYFIEGMPESAYHTAIKINEKWQDTCRGEIRIVKAFKYHGKLFCFYKDGKPFSAIIGSANLGVIKLEASNRRQYEISVITTNEQEVTEIAEHIEKLKMKNCSENIALIKNMPLVREANTALNEIELVTSVPKSNVEFYERCKAYVSFSLKLKVPKKDERHLDDGKHYTKSNINVCYAAPRNKRKARDWYETQLTVGADVYRMEK